MRSLKEANASTAGFKILQIHLSFIVNLRLHMLGLVIVDESYIIFGAIMYLII